MDPVEIRLIRKVFIKGRGAEVVRKIRPSPILREPFKDSAPSRSVFGYYDRNLQCNAVSSVLHRTRIDKGAMIKFRINCQCQSELICIVIFHF
jgi:hypothetical protein